MGYLTFTQEVDVEVDINELEDRLVEGDIGDEDKKRLATAILGSLSYEDVLAVIKELDSEIIQDWDFTRMACDYFEKEREKDKAENPDEYKDGTVVKASEASTEEKDDEEEEEEKCTECGNKTFSCDCCEDCGNREDDCTCEKCDGCGDVKKHCYCDDEEEEDNDSSTKMGRW